MAIQAQDLFTLARETELKVAQLYEDVAGHLKPGSEEARFFAKLAAQEHMHAAWVDEMVVQTPPDMVFTQLHEEDFRTIQTTIADVHDEVLDCSVDVSDTLEIVLHLENSIAEDFYLLFPTDLPASLSALLQRMIESSMNHVRMIVDFREHCQSTGQAGVHARPDQNAGNEPPTS